MAIFFFFLSIYGICFRREKIPLNISPGNLYVLFLEKIHLGNMCASTRELRFSGEYNVYARGQKMYGKRKEETLTDGIIIELRQDNKNVRKRIKK